MPPFSNHISNFSLFYIVVICPVSGMPVVYMNCWLPVFPSCLMRRYVQCNWSTTLFPLWFNIDFQFGYTRRIVTCKIAPINRLLSINKHGSNHQLNKIFTNLLIRYLLINQTLYSTTPMLRNQSFRNIQSLKLPTY